MTEEKQEREIAKSEWESFFNDFSKSHEGWIATVEVTGAQGEPEVEVKERPFSGASYDEPGTGETRIFVALADDDPSAHIEHSVINPSRVAVSEGGDEIRIESADGSVTLVRLVREASKPDVAAA
jgi:hypothetical protein